MATTLAKHSIKKAVGKGILKVQQTALVTPEKEQWRFSYEVFLAFVGEALTAYVMEKWQRFGNEPLLPNHHQPFGCLASSPFQMGCTKCFYNIRRQTSLFEAINPVWEEQSPNHQQAKLPCHCSYVANLLLPKQFFKCFSNCTRPFGSLTNSCQKDLPSRPSTFQLLFKLNLITFFQNHFGLLIQSSFNFFPFRSINPQQLQTKVYMEKWCDCHDKKCHRRWFQMVLFWIAPTPVSSRNGLTTGCAMVLAKSCPCPAITAARPTGCFRVMMIPAPQWAKL